MKLQICNNTDKDIQQIIKQMVDSNVINSESISTENISFHERVFEEDSVVTDTYYLVDITLSNVEKLNKMINDFSFSVRKTNYSSFDDCTGLLDVKPKKNVK